ncbi:MAG: hypothetical protein WCP89_03365 [archaeon]
MKKGSLNEIIKEELEVISLSKDEEVELENLAADVVKKLKFAAVSVGAKVDRISIGGSLAKGTLIRKARQDVDVFVVFSEDSEIAKLENIIKKASLGKDVSVKKVHGSRDYFQIVFFEGKIIFEIIPVLGVSKKGEFENVTDFSLIHVNYITKKISSLGKARAQKLSDEIKIAKAFCFAQGCYGAESYIRGFSGYALEVLVLHFGSFSAFLKNIVKKKVIDPEKHFKNENEILRELNASKLQSPIVIVDPTYKYRNVAAGLGKETFDKFLVSAGKFLKKPSIEMFEVKDLDIESLKKLAKQKKARFFEIELSTDRQAGDIAGTKMRKFFEFLCSQLERKGQKVLRKEFEYFGQGQSSRAYIVVREVKEIEVGGIELFRKDSVKNFKKVHKKTYMRGKKLFALQKVTLDDIFTHVKDFEQDMGVEIAI